MYRLALTVLLIFKCQILLFSQLNKGNTEVVVYSYPEFLKIEDLEVKAHRIVYNRDHGTGLTTIEEFRPHKENFNRNTYYVRKVIIENGNNPDTTEYFKISGKKWLELSRNNDQLESRIIRITRKMASSDTVSIFDIERELVERIYVHKYQRIK